MDSQQRPTGLKRVLGYFDSTTKVLLAIGGLVAAATALWAGISKVTVHPPKPGATPDGTVSSSQFVVTPESCGALNFAADGTAGPVTCPDGRPNVAADRYYRQLHLEVLSLGANATPAQVNTAICYDLRLGGHSSFPIETEAVQLAEAEQAWHFTLNPVDNIGPGLCPSASPSPSA